MSVVTAFEDLGPCQKKLVVEVPAQAVEAEWGRVVNSLRREVNLPGFRKGKVPASLLKKRFHEDIQQQVVDTLLPRYWRQAQAEKSLDILLPPQVEELKVELGEPMSFTASVEIRPEIEIGELASFDLPEDSTEPTEEEVEEAKLDLRRQQATWEEVDRAAATGDLIMGQAIPAEAPEGEDEAKPRPVYIEIGGQGVEEELSLALTGLKAGQSAEHTRKFEEDGEDREETFRIEVEVVKEQSLPEMDDAMAERLGLDDLAALEEAIHQQVSMGKARAHDEQRHRTLMDQLRERYPVELPPRVIQQESERMVRDYFERMSAQGMPMDPDKVNWEELMGSVRPNAVNRVHERLVLDAVAAAESLRLDENEFEHFLARAAAEQKTSSMALRQRLSENGMIEELRADLLRQQTVRHLLGDLDDEAGDDESAAGSEDE